MAAIEFNISFDQRWLYANILLEGDDKLRINTENKFRQESS